ncbi:unnamed protein product, partial [Amoebophrya sp. A25]
IEGLTCPASLLPVCELDEGRGILSISLALLDGLLKRKSNNFLNKSPNPNPALVPALFRTSLSSYCASVFLYFHNHKLKVKDSSIFANKHILSNSLYFSVRRSLGEMKMFAARSTRAENVRREQVKKSS